MSLFMAEKFRKREYTPDLRISRIGRFHSYGGYLNEMVPGVTDIHLIEEGRGAFEIGSRTVLPSPGHIVALFPGESVRYRDRKASPWQYTWFSLEGNSVAPILRSLGLTPDSPELRGDFRAVLDPLLKETETAYTHETYSLLYPSAAAWRVIDALDTSIRTPGPAVSNPVMELKRHLDTYFFSPGLSIGALADRIGVSRVVLCRGFREHFGVSPKGYLSRLRLEKSRRMLRNGIETVRQVAESCGYKDSRYFARVFGSRFGCTPLEFRYDGKHPTRASQ